MIILFLMSFSSFCYLALIAKMTYLYIQDDTLAYAIVSFVYFLGLSRGCTRYLRSRDLLNLGALKYRLVSNEYSLAIAGAQMGLYFCLLPILMATLESLLPTAQPDAIQFLAAVSGMLVLSRLGFFLGIEIALIYRVFEAPKKEHNSVGMVIAWTYLGGLAASATCAFWLFKQVNPGQFLLIPTLVSLGLAVYLTKELLQSFSSWQKAKVLGKAVVAVLALVLLAAAGDDLYRKGKFILYDVGNSKIYNRLGERLRFLERSMQITSKAGDYQVADWVTYLETPIFSRLYLDGAFQFDSIDEAGYHEPFWRGGLHFSGRQPERVLIMGGGDVLLAKRILHDSEFHPEVTLVELDALIPEMAERYWHNLEQGALRVVRLTIANAFDYIRSASGEWSAIYLDFPDPRSADLSKLYSVEFYQMVRRHLRTDGYIVLDYPAGNSPSIIFSTLEAAGFKTVIQYGKGHTFVYADARARAKEELQELKAKSPFAVQPTAEVSPDAVNSVFNPKLPEDKGLNLIESWATD